MKSAARWEIWIDGYLFLTNLTPKQVLLERAAARNRGEVRIRLHRIQ